MNPRWLALLLALPASAQTTWYVDAAATPPGLGTQADPYASIQYALYQPTTVNGDTLLVAPGTYIENIFATKDVTLRSTLGPTVTTIRPAAPGNALRLFGSPMTVEGFTITGATGHGIEVQGLNYIRRCIIRDNAGHGVFGVYDARLVNCTVTGNGTGVSAVPFGGSAGLENCIVVSNGTDLLNMNGSGGLWTTNCIDGAVDPGFWSYVDRDFHLRPGSIAIDAGYTGVHGVGPDPDGSPPDIGALTYDAAYAPAPTTYCTAKMNSLGCVPAIGAVGSASTSGAPFTITCTNELNNKLGLLFYGHVPMAAAYQGGWLCVSSPVKRTPVSDSLGNMGVDDCSGVYSFDFGALIQSGTDPALAAGELIYAQFWSRDPGASFTTNRSDALRFGVAP